MRKPAQESSSETNRESDYMAPAAPANGKLKRGRPKKFCDEGEVPILENLFPKNNTVIVSAILLYVGKVIKILGSGITNKGFLVYEFDDRVLNMGGKVP
jgi:hypothetical protein